LIKNNSGASNKSNSKIHPDVKKNKKNKKKKVKSKEIEKNGN
jgi:hypothetical protein